MTTTSVMAFSHELDETNQYKEMRFDDLNYISVNAQDADERLYNERKDRCKVRLYDYQIFALKRLRSGSILCGEVGSGKTLTALAFYSFYFFERDLYVITTAKKRDTGDWENEAALVGVECAVVDSWNNVSKYKNVRNAFFIFDEQRVSRLGAWGKSFVKIAKANKWILLSATPGDVWMDYLPVFLANGYYRNKTEFINRHVEFDRFAKYQKVKAYHDEVTLYRYLRKTIVPMRKGHKTRRNRVWHNCDFDKDLYFTTLHERWHIYDNHPIENPAQMTQVARRIVNSSEARQDEVLKIFASVDRAIVFYNYNYELDILKMLCEAANKPMYQWNGMVHDPVPTGDEWIYLCHYASAEGWNCITTNVVVFYSLNYSYRIMEQAEGRIDRVNTTYEDLYYHYVISNSSVDRSILHAIRAKKKFNEALWGEEAPSHERKRVSSKTNKRY